MSSYVFLGPSLPVADARAVLDVEYLPPVSCGDITELVLDREPPTAIGIVDGFFEQVPAVWHKEILFAISNGVHVYGASSMGALRAAELRRFGMHGVGRVFEAFASGEYTDDDEVTIVHAAAEDGYRPLSDAMVNLRAGLDAARAAGIISAQTRENLRATAKSTYYPDRSWPRLLADGLEQGVPSGELAGLRDFVRAERPDVKRDDALALLRRMSADLADGLPPPVADFDLEPTFYWEKLLAIVRQERAARHGDELIGAGPAALRRYLGQHQPAVLDAALGRVLAEREAQRLGLIDDAGVPLDGDAARQALSQRYAGDLVAPALAELDGRGLVEATRALLRESISDSGPEWDDSAAPLPAGRRE
jgi:hypothetical protein